MNLNVSTFFMTGGKYMRYDYWINHYTGASLIQMQLKYSLFLFPLKMTSCLHDCIAKRYKGIYKEEADCYCNFFDVVCSQ